MLWVESIIILYNQTCQLTGGFAISDHEKEKTAEDNMDIYIKVYI